MPATSRLHCFGPVVQPDPWPSATTNSTLYNAYPAGTDPGSGSGERWGDTMAARGSGVNTQILLGSRGTNVALLTTPNGTDFTATLIPVAGVPSSFAGYGIAFGAGNTFWAKNYLGDLFEISFDPDAGVQQCRGHRAGLRFPPVTLKSPRTWWGWAWIPCITSWAAWC